MIKERLIIGEEVHGIPFLDHKCLTGCLYHLIPHLLVLERDISVGVEAKVAKICNFCFYPTLILSRFMNPVSVDVDRR